MSQHLSGDTSAWLVLLRDVILVVLICRAGALSAGDLVERLRGRDVDLSRAKLGVVKQEGSLSSRLFLKGHGG